MMGFVNANPRGRDGEVRGGGGGGGMVMGGEEERKEDRI